MASRKTQSRRKKASQKEAQKRNTTNALIIIAVIIIVIMIASSAGTPEPESPPITIQTAPPPTVERTTEEESAAPPEFERPTGPISFDAPPEMTIDTDATYLAAVKMANGGEFIIEFYPQKAPLTVNSFIFLAREGYFDGTTFHRVLEGFMAQAGDPTGTGMGGPGYEFVNEDSDLKFDKEGVVAMANAGRDTNGSQFFITFGPAPFLDGGYTIFGQVIEGMDVVHNITLRDPNKNPNFEGDLIESITIIEN